MSENHTQFHPQKNHERRDSFTSIFHTDDTPVPEAVKNLVELAKQTQHGKSVSPYFKPAIKHLSRKLAVLVSVTTVQPHPDAPKSLLEYHLLTHQQLDDIARHYHQVWPPVPETFQYPKIIPAWIGTKTEGTTDIATKRRRIGRFIGMQGCESPVESSFDVSVHAAEDSEADEKLRNGIAQRMAREWQDALLRARMEASSQSIVPPKNNF